MFHQSLNASWFLLLILIKRSIYMQKLEGSNYVYFSVPVSFISANAISSALMQSSWTWQVSVKTAVNILGGCDIQLDIPGKLFRYLLPIRVQGFQYSHASALQSKICWVVISHSCTGLCIFTIDTCFIILHRALKGLFQLLDVCDMVKHLGSIYS